MSRYLVVSDCYPADLSHGRTLRVHHLCLELARKHECYLVDFEGKGEAAASGMFAGRISLPPVPAKSHRSLRRMFRMSNARYLELSSPKWWKQAVHDCQVAFDRWECSAALSFAPSIAEVTAALNGFRVLDWLDSATLTYRRRLAVSGTGRTLPERWIAGLQARRQRQREAALVNCFDLTVTIAEPDRRVLLDVAGIEPERVRVVPNGVDEKALCAGADRPPPGRSIIFWGNLDFPPNASAVRWFYRSVWQPHLVGRGLEWHIAGAGAAADIKALASEPGIILHGFVDDLYGLARQQGLMVNPMVEGSGLKNKVLESFAIGLPVVSTSMGMEAIDAEDGRYCRIADGPAEFAAAVLDLLSRPAHAEALSVAARQLVYSRYTWTVAGEALAEILGVAGDHRVQASAA